MGVEGGILCLSSANLGNNGFDGGFYYSFYAERDKGLKMPLPPLTCDARTHEHLAQKKEKIIIPPRFIFLFLACCVGDGRREGTPLLIRRLKCHAGDALRRNKSSRLVMRPRDLNKSNTIIKLNGERKHISNIFITCGEVDRS